MRDTQQLLLERFTAEQRRLFGYIVTLLPNFDDAEDAFQETCLRIWAKSAQYDPNRDFLAWACGFAKNVVREIRQKKYRGHALLSERAMEDLAETRFRAAATLEVWQSKLSECLDRLPQPQRELIAQCYAGNEAIEAVAEHIHTTRDALYMRLMRIRRRLADCLEGRDDSEGEP